MTTDFIRLIDAAPMLTPAGQASVHEKTLRRWASRGVTTFDGRLVFLKTQRVGRRLVTTKQWVEEFITNCSAAESATKPRQRRATDDEVLERLRSRGMKI